MVTTLRACYRAYRDLDAMMVEINPLAITGGGATSWRSTPRCPSTPNALFRRPQVAALRDPAQEDAREAMAADHGLAYVGPRRRYRLHHQRCRSRHGHDGHDQACGGVNPRTSSTSAAALRPTVWWTAFRTVLTDPNVSVILVNIFAGINRCDWIAKGVVQAYKEVGLTIPVVVRLSGTNVTEGRAILDQADVPIITAGTLAEAAEAAVAARPQPVAAE